MSHSKDILRDARDVLGIPQDEDDQRIRELEEALRDARPYVEAQVDFFAHEAPALVARIDALLGEKK